jgi:hypothetical protein
MSSDTRIAETLRTNRGREENNIKEDLKGVVSILGWEMHQNGSGENQLGTLHQMKLQ